MSEKEFLSLVEVAETIADNKFILGDRLVDVGISGPTIEAALSSIAMAQQELGHARLIYKWGFDLKGNNSSNIEIKQQTGKAFQHNLEIANWLELIAGLYATNIAVDLVMRAIIAADHPGLKTPFNKMLREQQEHLIYSKSWCRQLLQDKGSIPRRFKGALQNASEQAREWLNKVEKDSGLITENIISKDASLVESFNQHIQNTTSMGAVSNAV